ncbi:unnamed protein product [Trifolium pratense]|uniref:Uncharacterized protein n=1 Tax=Trifolium pratense TaxID=57577 RepID=A0ACB0JIT9_TRIPR|nr:unnamed protein product [Trifolium pratense]
MDDAYKGYGYTLCDYRCECDDDYYSPILGMALPPFLSDFAKEMIANSLSIGYVSSSKLAIDHETGLGGGFGFVTFVTKEDAQKAIEECNGYVYGWDKCTMKVDRATPIPGMVVPPFLLDFAKEMIAKSDDKTVLATHLSRQTKEDAHLLELFKPIGDVSSAKLAAIDHETGLGGGFGFVTFFTKEDAQKAIEERRLGQMHHES